jgi:Calx-beta domain
MAVGDIKTFDIITADLVLKINAIDLGGGQVRFDVQHVSGSGDINAIYWGDNGVADNSQFNLGGPLNMNGSAIDFDAGLKLSDPGLGPDGLNKATFLGNVPGETLTRDAAINFDNLDTVGIRATSTGPNQQGSIKGGDDTPVLTEAPKAKVDDVCVFEEEGAVAKFTVSLEGNEPYPYDVKINYTTVDGTAVAGEDYVTTAGYVVIPAGETEACVEVPILNDDNPEDKESFTLDLTTASADIPGDDIAVVICNDGIGEIKDTDVVVPPPPPPPEQFPDNGHDLSYATFYFADDLSLATPQAGDVDGKYDGNPANGPDNTPDGVYTVKANFAGDPSGDLDDYYADLLGDIIVLDPNVTPTTPVLGVAIHAGLGAPDDSLQFYAIDGNEDADPIPDPPVDAAQNNEVDTAYTYTPVSPTTGDLV